MSDSDWDALHALGIEAVAEMVKGVIASLELIQTIYTDVTDGAESPAIKDAYHALMDVPEWRD